MTQLDPHYVDPRLVALYDVECGWSADRDFYLGLAGPAPRRLLDLGCGTGLICDAWAARGHEVTGADPAAQMLEVARRKPNGARIEWVQATAQDFRSAKRFDLTIMTGHAFQVLIEDRDIIAAFDTMQCHLAPGGVAAFESRNPRVDRSSRWHGRVSSLAVEGQPVQIHTSVTAARPGLVSFEQRFQFPDTALVSPSTLRFLDRAGIEQRLASAGLAVDHLFGTWDGRPFDEATSDEMIFIVRAA
jgi:ubiquinone/menaquinone biosynthesis C-methylase UbiE